MYFEWVSEREKLKNWCIWLWSEIKYYGFVWWWEGL